ncbi:hypothetical protein COV19_02795 [Candidatus Woesearchaeota archaeon CG10_big_fil_rev_8_21_14_0_10_44_13]|nr:MAG: hypothetical protein COV19_02795 [Candidatus Woesearchaeota archaeon CG10_big_fil_rev_8_21_14_0_10_44_13]
MPKRMKKWVIGAVFVLIIASLASLVYAQSGTIKLLAVSDTPDGLVGSMADLKLDVKKGDGRVFIDTLPASKLDTQITTRFARDMACRYLRVDCSRSDFFYTVIADSTIIGGPSAGAATTILTISLMGKIPLDNNTVVTGTINSGYLIGSVGGVKEKIETAAKRGFKKVLIPRTEIYFEKDNKSIDYVDYGRQLNIEVVRVSDVDEALHEFTGKDFRKNGKQVEIDPSYKDTMALLASELCNRSFVISEKDSILREGRNDSVVNDRKFIELYEKADNLTRLGREAYNDGRYYSSASYCFGANVNYHYLLFKLQDVTDKQVADMIETTDREISILVDFLNNYDIKTITDLQAYTVSKERAMDAADYLNMTIEDLKGNLEGDSKGKRMDSALSNLAYAIERMYSASSWSKFLGKEGKEFNIEKNDLMASCMNKVNEAEEYFQYMQLVFPGLMRNVAEDINNAEEDYKKENYELCLHKASLAKAEVSIVLSTIGFKEENLQQLLDMKLNAAKKTIIEQQESGIFPIVGYSYYEYSQSLRNESIYSALLYSEYGLELSNLDIYFKPRAKAVVVNKELFDIFLIFLGGAVFGAIMMILFAVPRSAEYRPKKIKLPVPQHKKFKFDFSRGRRR